MKNIHQIISIILLFVTMVLLASCQEKQEVDSLMKHYYSTGELKHEISMKDSLLHGLSTTYYKSGKKKYEKYFFENVPINHHYYYSEEGDLLAYKFYDVRGHLRYQLFADTLDDSFSQDGKSIYIQGEFKENYNKGDSVSLIPIVANPFKSSYKVILLTEDERINKSYNFSDSISPLFLYSVKEGHNPLKIISEIKDDNGNLYKKDTISLDLIGDNK